MCNSIKSVSYLLNITPALSTILKEAEKYYAHIPPKSLEQQIPAEILQDHVELVQSKFEKLVEAHHLDKVIDSLISTLIKKFSFENDAVLANFIKKLFINTVVYHDYGKINENFQASPQKMNNTFFLGKERFQNIISTHHSALGAYLYLVKHLEEVNTFPHQQQGFLSTCVLILSYPIFKHHASKLQDEYQDTIGFSAEQVKCMKEYIKNYQFQINPHFSEIFVLQEKTTKAFEHLDHYISSNSIEFFITHCIRLSSFKSVYEWK
jgi:CRISPR-associated endonuclease/helicase Cas3